MRRALATLGAACLCFGLISFLARGREVVRSFKTAGDAVLCLTADMLPQAYEAEKDKDPSRLRELGCFPMFGGVEATRVDTKTGSPVWHVRLEPKGGEPMTVWGYHHAFRSSAGEPLDQDGRIDKAKR